jgi:hypothetical protein
MLLVYFILVMAEIFRTQKNIKGEFEKNNSQSGEMHF